MPSSVTRVMAVAVAATFVACAPAEPEAGPVPTTGPDTVEQPAAPPTEPTTPPTDPPPSAASPASPSAPAVRFAAHVAADTVRVPLEAAAGSAVEGTVTLLEEEDGTAITVRLENGPQEETLAVSLITGSCEEAVESLPLYAIETDEDGYGLNGATVNLPLAALQAEAVAVVVESEADATRLLCGELGTGGAAPDPAL